MIYHIYPESSNKRHDPLSFLHKSIAGRHQPVRVADGPITARYRFIKNGSWGANSVDQDPTPQSTILHYVRTCSSETVSGNYPDTVESLLF